MSSLPTYGYDAGLISNSMLQAAVTCPVKYDLMYNKGIRPDKQGVWFNHALVGNIVHDCIEKHDNDLVKLKSEMWGHFESLIGDPDIMQRMKNLMFMHKQAVDATMAEGQRWGRTYKAPEMTSYWKKNYGGLAEITEGIDDDVRKALPRESVLELPFSEMVKKASKSLENWPVLRISDATGVEVQVTGEVGPEGAKKSMVGTINRLEPRGEGEVAICDYKTGRWAYDVHSVANSDQFGLYTRLLEGSDNVRVVEWVLYDVYVGNVTRVKPTPGILDKFDLRLGTNLKYLQQLEDRKQEVALPTPAGSSYKLGCPCILAKTGDCPYVYEPENH